MKFLLDTVVLSETRKSRPDSNVVAWLAAVPKDDLYVSVATLYEIRRGIAMVERRNPPFARALTHWLEQLSRAFADRILPIDGAVALRWGSLSVRLGNEGVDIVIAATALEHGLVVATRNTGDFLPAGVPVLDPFDLSPAVIRPPL